MISEILATKAVEYLILQISGGALEKIGADAKDSLQRLITLLSTKFFGKQEFQQAVQNPSGLEAVIQEEAAKDASFRLELEEIVQKLVVMEENKSPRVSQVSTGFGANMNVASNSGTMIGTQNQNNFR